jgi:hypothetical protein
MRIQRKVTPVVERETTTVVERRTPWYEKPGWLALTFASVLALGLLGWWVWEATRPGPVLVEHTTTHVQGQPVSPAPAPPVVIQQSPPIVQPPIVERQAPPPVIVPQIEREREVIVTPPPAQQQPPQQNQQGQQGQQGQQPPPGSGADDFPNWTGTNQGTGW